ncbi:MAG: 30S ribosomal protein S17 [Candidatus Latescibacteria bacterium]|nr:30S ribosomal protein S17 [Candidatus Latescibacterota bacterium]
MSERGLRKVRTGRVTSARMDKTVVVTVDRLVRHRLYGKVIKRRSKLYAHDEENQCAEGDIVKVTETRPLSKTKCWRVVEIVKKATG